MTTHSEYIQEKQTLLFSETGTFFAFSEAQFNHAKIENVDYVSLGSGLIVPKNNAKKLIEGLKQISVEGRKKDIEDNGKYKIIRRELFDHECFYTGDIGDCVDKLKSYGIT